MVEEGSAEEEGSCEKEEGLPRGTREPLGSNLQTGTQLRKRSSSSACNGRLRKLEVPYRLVPVAAYYEEFGLTPLGGGRFSTVDGGEQLRLVPADGERGPRVVSDHLLAQHLLHRAEDGCFVLAPAGRRGSVYHPLDLLLRCGCIVFSQRPRVPCQRLADLRIELAPCFGRRVACTRPGIGQGAGEMVQMGAVAGEIPRAAPIFRRGEFTARTGLRRGGGQFGLQPVIGKGRFPVFRRDRSQSGVAPEVGSEQRVEYRPLFRLDLRRNHHRHRHHDIGREFPGEPRHGGGTRGGRRNRKRRPRR